ncbi:PPE domain-containing protein [Mycobacteroides abscessus]|uniref:PPE domain-containing protein n=1 Tax=Mycobacteroides abscessus TaxID=36809 RepID=UPI0009289C13|nr:PPE domain-containing protein [Mycobacteroides abscessus]SHV74279.1 PPE-repeat proteins [Mycobacteroides abscessus subsp. abscessus]SHW33087.1 PPE-repeat proteins [Mycobacteroides abscessus subsp. abscessus]SHW39212.1 PPE-repeat proteins [Mycobacteroides abscessus subsp. abscessus]SHW67680.1 PPE-repeat proteins [Mycobacteroides abscessus subsp. abscessus]SHX16656.1 PPE-repeat proteins [Mycobacteroides abscessus subsp. abscessus]
MGADIRVDTEGLAADGAQLSSMSGGISGPVLAQPPGADVTSASVVAQLNAHAAALTTHLTHAAAVRVHGGIVTQAVAAGFDLADQDYAALLSDPASGRVPAPAAVPNIAAPELPPLPTIPAAATLPDLTGEAHARAIHTGPGPSSLYEAASYWRGQASQLQLAADQAKHLATRVETHWDDQNPKAATNIRRHGDWLADASSKASALAGAYNDAGDHFTSHRRETPPPQDFDNVRNLRNRAIMLNNNPPIGAYSAKIAEYTEKYGELQSRATAAAGSYHTMSGATTGSIAPPPNPAPPIAGITSTLTPAEPVPQGPARDLKEFEPNKPAGGKPKTKGTLDDPQAGAKDLANPDSAPIAALSDTPPIDQAAPVDPATMGSASNIAGTLLGAGLGSLSQLSGGGGAPSMPSGSPLSGLSGLGSPPQMPSGGQPSMPDTGSGGGAPETGEGLPSESGTSPATGFGGAGGGSAPSVSPVPAAPGAVPTLGAASAATGATGATGAGMGGGMPFMPPMGMGGQGNDAAQRNKNLYPDKRVVIRPTPNTEPVFGAVERERKNTKPKKEDGGTK